MTTVTAACRAVNGDKRPWPRGTLLANLSPASRARLLRLGEPRHVGGGDVIVWEQERSNHVVLLAQALVKITASLENGRVALLGIRISGDLVGEMAAFDGSPRSATVTACGDATVLTIQRAELLDFLCSCPDANLAMYQMIIQRLRWANRRRVDFNGYHSGIRLGRALVELAEQYGRHTREGIALDVGLTHYELGALIGADADTVGKELRELKSRGVVRTGYRRLVIRDLDMLKASSHMTD